MIQTHQTQVAPAAGLIKEVTAQSFMQDVMQLSLQVPVLLYFTASWCGPCKQFGPTLEKVVSAAGGKLRLAKVDIDKNQQIAAQFGVQSVPTVFVIFQGQPVDAFQGAIPEGQIKQYLAKLGIDIADHSAEEMLAQAEELLAVGQADEADTIFKQVNTKDPQNARAIAGVAKVMIANKRYEEAEKLFSQLPDTMLGNEHIAQARSALALAKQAGQGGADLAKLRMQVEKNPNDHQARFDLAVQSFAAGKQEEAIEELLTIFRKDRQWNEDAARKQLVQFFEALGHTHPLTVQGRRKLSSLMFS